MQESETLRAVRSKLNDTHTPILSKDRAYRDLYLSLMMMEFWCEPRASANQPFQILKIVDRYLIEGTNRMPLLTPRATTRRKSMCNAYL